MKISEVLEAAAVLVEKGWTQGAYARGKRGGWVPSDSTAAVCFCAEGAINRALGAGPVQYIEGSEYHKIVRFVESVLAGQPLCVFNDAPERTSAEVAALLRQAAEKAKVE